MSDSVTLERLREALRGKPLLGFDTSGAGADALQKLSSAKIGTKPTDSQPTAGARLREI
jgi:hypothetical protein